MAVKKSELYSSLWQSCDELRGGMDASQYKDYVLTLLFVKYVSDKYAGQPFAPIDVPGGGAFADMVALRGDKEIGDKMNKIVGRLAEANGLKGVIDLADFNDEDKLGKGKAMVDRLSNLVGIFRKLDLGANRVSGDDLLGDAYEYLMRHFATESGKSKGQFYTPAEVSRILAKVIGVPAGAKASRTVYDPTCGSGSLLLKVAEEAGGALSLYGQEMDHATSALAKMNMILHGNATAEIWQDNTLAAPQWTGGAAPDGSGTTQLKRFDFAVANPPFSYKSWSNGLKPEDDAFGRFAGFGVPPKRNGDYAFLLHILASLKSEGRAAVILPHGVLFRGNAEADIRRQLLARGFIKAIIGLPPNLFYGTGIPACIVVIDKAGGLPAAAQGGLFADGDVAGTGAPGGDGAPQGHDPQGASAGAGPGVFMIDASRGFRKDGNKNRLRERDIHKVVDVYRAQRAVAGYARFVPMAEIEENGFNLNLPRYIDASEAEDRHDLEAHLKGGIPERDLDALQAYWDVFPRLRADLFEPARPGYARAQVPARKVKTAILEHPDFQAFAEQVAERTAAWRAAHEPTLRVLDAGADPKALIHDLAEDLLARFEGAPLIDRYAVYQRLMDFWAETMQDDVYVLAQDGWAAARVARPTYESEAAEFSLKEGRRTVGYVGEVLPARLVVRRFFAEEQAALEQLQADLDEAEQRLAEFEEEHSAEGGALDGLEGSRGVTKGNVQDRVQELKDAALDAFAEGTPEHEQAAAMTKTNFGTRAWTHGRDDAEGIFAELDVLYDYLSLYDAVTTGKSARKEAEAKLYAAVVAQYPALTDAQAKDLVVGEKWIATVEGAVRAEVERVTQQLAGRVEELEARYAEALPELERSVEARASDVDEHLKTMVAAWN